MNTIYIKLRHSLSIVYMKLKLIRAFLLHQTCNSVVPIFSHKLRERAFYSLLSCFFTFNWCMFVIPEPHDWWCRRITLIILFHHQFLVHFGAPFGSAPWAAA